MPRDRSYEELLSSCAYQFHVHAHVGQVIGTVLRGEQMFDVLVAGCSQRRCSVIAVETVLDQMRGLTQSTQMSINARVLMVIVDTFAAVVDRMEWATYDADGNQLEVDTPEGVVVGSVTWKLLGITNGNPLWAHDIKSFVGRSMEQLEKLQEASISAGHFRRYAQKAKSGRRTGKKRGRNQPCGCGSGKKFKKCCAEPWPRIVERGEGD